MTGRLEMRGDGATGQSAGQAVVRVALAGATGRTGNAVANGLAAYTGVRLVACAAPSVASTPTRSLPPGVAAFADVAAISEPYDVLVDLTTAEAAPANLERARANGAHVVLGTTGLSDAELQGFGEQFAAAGLGLLYIPNFSIGAVLMMRFAAEAARHLHDVEIIETHHARKLDAPSGTARRTAELVAAAGGRAATDGGSAARGELVAGIPVHSLRLPGAMAHQEVVLGGPGELLTIRHDAIDRDCYTAGVALAVRGVAGYVGLTVGLEHVL